MELLQLLSQAFAQGQAMRRIPMYMKDWIEKLNGFLTLNEREILNNAGSISHTLATSHQNVHPPLKLPPPQSPNNPSTQCKIAYI